METVGYENSLRQAREILITEINDLKEQLARKELSLRKLDSFLKEPYESSYSGISLTQRVVEIVYELVSEHNKPITAKEVVKEFHQERKDVNESTIRSTLYQVSRKQKPTEIEVNGHTIDVAIIKEGPIYDVEIVNTTAELEHINA